MKQCTHLKSSYGITNYTTPLSRLHDHVNNCIISICKGLMKGPSLTVMSGSPAAVMRLVASAYCVAEKAGSIVRRVLHGGDLGIVEKVVKPQCTHTQPITHNALCLLCYCINLSNLTMNPMHRPELMTCRRWRTDWHSRASVPHCPDGSRKSPSLERRWVKRGHRELFWFLMLENSGVKPAALILTCTTRKRHNIVVHSFQVVPNVL